MTPPPPGDDEEGCGDCDEDDARRRDDWKTQETVVEMEREKKWTRLCSLKSLRPALVDLWFRAEKGSLRAGLTRDLFVSSRGHLTGTARFFVAQL